MHSKILAIETSCDETAVAILEAEGNSSQADFSVRANVVLSQVALHAEYGGVFPSLAKREHAKNLVPLLVQALKDAGIFRENAVRTEIPEDFEMLFEREPELLAQFKNELPKLEKPPIDAIAVTYGPGLEPALWVGINFAKALASLWNIPILPINHMEGHVFSAWIRGKTFSISPVPFPALALLVSGGHTELILIKKMLSYTIIGQTRDDAVGEAFDKVGRMLGLPYPGGPAVARLAETCEAIPAGMPALPRPMIHSSDFDFSFSGLKTAVLYFLKDLQKKNEPLDENMKACLCREFEEAATDVLVSKTLRAAETQRARVILTGGGVSANMRLREKLLDAVREKIPNTPLLLPDAAATGDNALMIAVAGFYHFLQKPAGVSPENIIAQGNLRLSN